MLVYIGFKVSIVIVSPYFTHQQTGLSTGPPKGPLPKLQLMLVLQTAQLDKPPPSLPGIQTASNGNGIFQGPGEELLLQKLLHICISSVTFRKVVQGSRENMETTQTNITFFRCLSMLINLRPLKTHHKTHRNSWT